MKTIGKMIALGLFVPVLWGIIISCGGSGSGDAPGGNNNTAPVADAGPDQNSTLGAQVTLDGSGSSDADGDGITYLWSFTANPGSAVLSGETTAAPAFTPSGAGTYTLRLVVNDGVLDSAPDTVSVIVTRVSSLPETGQILCYNAAGTEISCSGSGQDGEFTSNPMSFTDNGDGTVTDKVTGLMWQKSSDSASITWTASVSHCSGHTLGGYTDWRLPTIGEFTGIIDFSVSDPAIDTTVFTGVISDSYWAATEAAFNSTDYAWYLYALYGETLTGGKTNTSYALCVRGAESPAQSFTDNGDGTVTDNNTHLIWQKEDDNVDRSWEDALTYCNGLPLGGYDDWRLPDIKELASIVDTGVSGQSINGIFSPGTDDYYWSSTSYSFSPSNAWRVEFIDGAVNSFGKSSPISVRCVR